MGRQDRQAGGRRLEIKHHAGRSAKPCLVADTGHPPGLENLDLVGQVTDHEQRCRIGSPDEQGHRSGRVSGRRDQGYLVGQAMFAVDQLDLEDLVLAYMSRSAERDRRPRLEVRS